MSPKVTLIPVGWVSENLLLWLTERLPDILDVEVAVGQGIPLPSEGYNPQRRQIEGTAILGALRARPQPDADQVMGLTKADCYSNGLSFIFGQAVLNGREAFVALPRLHQSYYDLPEDEALFRTRVLKEVVHELGHTWGLAHCPNRHCVMHFSNTLHDTDIKGAYFCEQCQKQLQPEIERVR